MDSAQLMQNSLGGIAKWSGAKLSLVDIASASPKVGPRFDSGGVFAKLKQLG